MMMLHTTAELIDAENRALSYNRGDGQPEGSGKEVQIIGDMLRALENNLKYYYPPEYQQEWGKFMGIIKSKKTRPDRDTMKQMDLPPSSFYRMMNSTIRGDRKNSRKLLHKLYDNGYLKDSISEKLLDDLLGFLGFQRMRDNVGDEILYKCITVIDKNKAVSYEKLARFTRYTWLYWRCGKNGISDSMIECMKEYFHLPNDLTRALKRGGTGNELDVLAEMKKYFKMADGELAALEKLVLEDKPLSEDLKNLDTVLEPIKKMETEKREAARVKKDRIDPKLNKFIREKIALLEQYNAGRSEQYRCPDCDLTINQITDQLCQMKSNISYINSGDILETLTVYHLALGLCNSISDMNDLFAWAGFSIQDGNRADTVVKELISQQYFGKMCGAETRKTVFQAATFAWALFERGIRRYNAVWRGEKDWLRGQFFKRQSELLDLEEGEAQR